MIITLLCLIIVVSLPLACSCYLGYCGVIAGSLCLDAALYLLLYRFTLARDAAAAVSRWRRGFCPVEMPRDAAQALAEISRHEVSLAAAARAMITLLPALFDAARWLMALWLKPRLAMTSLYFTSIIAHGHTTLYCF